MQRILNNSRNEARSDAMREIETKYCLGLVAICEISIVFIEISVCPILFTNHVSRNEHWDIFQKIIGTSQIATRPRQYKRKIQETFQCTI